VLLLFSLYKYSIVALLAQACFFAAFADCKASSLPASLAASVSAFSAFDRVARQTSPFRAGKDSADDAAALKQPLYI
jgi:hypothetical protein